jgi:hypothetical protein
MDVHQLMLIKMYVSHDHLPINNTQLHDPENQYDLPSNASKEIDA